MCDVCLCCLGLSNIYQEVMMSKLLAITWIVVLSHVCVIGVVSKHTANLKSNIQSYLNTNANVAIR